MRVRHFLEYALAAIGAVLVVGSLTYTFTTNSHNTSYEPSMSSRDESRPIPEDFNRANMTPAQEQIWIIAYTNAMANVRAPSAFYRAPSLAEQVKNCEQVADFIAASAPVKTLPSGQVAESSCASLRDC